VGEQADGVNQVDGPGAPGTRRPWPLFDYMILERFGRLLEARNLRSNWITDSHRALATHSEIAFDDLGDALVAAVLTWYAFSAVSIVAVVLFGLLAEAIEGGHMDAVTFAIFTLLFWFPIFAVPSATISSIRRRLLSLSGRVRKPVDDETKVRRYRPRQFDFWISAASATGFVVVAFLHQ
jgi:hypothetical protein